MSAALVPTRPQFDAFEAATKLVLDSLTSECSKKAYRTALRDFLIWFRDQWRGSFNKAAVNAYRTELLLAGRSGATVNLKLASIRKLALEASDNNLLPADVAAAVARVRCVKVEGTRTGTWISLQQAQALLNAPDITTLQGLRDRALIALLLGTGIRREEACTLTCEHLQVRDGRTVLLDLKGKGGRLRTVPVPGWTKQALDAWMHETGISSGLVIRQTDRRLLAGKRLSSTRVWQLVQQHASAAGLGDLAPHDLRRSCARFCRASGAELEQIQILLGHSSVVTTERYLGTKQDLVNGPNDAIKLGIKPPDARRAPSIDVMAGTVSREHGTTKLAQGTVDAYRQDWHDFKEWCVARGITSLPATPETIALYLADRAHLKPDTLKRRLVAINRAHSTAGYKSPAKLRHAAVSEALDNIRRMQLGLGKPSRGNK